MTKKQKKERKRIFLAAVSFLIACLLPVTGWLRLLIFIGAYIVAGGDIVLQAGRNILHGQVFDENFLMTIATIGAFFVGEYPEAIAVMLFYRIGEFFQSYAVGKSRKSISSLMELCPEYANVLENGEMKQVDPDLVSIGDTIVVKAGERIPLDGIVVSGSSALDTSALTGESIPRSVREGDEVMSGCVNQNGTLTIKVQKEYQDSTVARILELVESASERKAEAEHFITKFAAYYTPVVVILAVVLAVVPPIVLKDATFSDWIYRALNFLVVSCPCALVISIPLSFFGGIGGAAKQGILVKGSNYLEALAQAEIAVFDKTGTLTKGNFVVTKCMPSELLKKQVSVWNEELEKQISNVDFINEAEKEALNAHFTQKKEQVDIEEEAKSYLLFLASGAEQYSNHPIAKSIQTAYGKIISSERMEQTETITGKGVKAVIDGKQVLVGNRKLLEEAGILNAEQTISLEAFSGGYIEEEAGTVVYVAVDNMFAGKIVIADEIKEDAKTAITSLRELGLKKAVMLTGDAKKVGEQVAKELGLDLAYTELLPADKVKHMQDLLQETSPKGKLVFAGDGMNDAPVLAGADIGIAMGGVGSDAAIEAADIVIITDEPSKVAQAIQIARKTIRIVKQNVVFALAVKIGVLILSACGISNLWAAVFADVGVSVIAILNAMRAVK